MKQSIMEYLVCPDCRGSLRLTTFIQAENHIEEGFLQCEACKVQYPIVRGVPRLLPTSLLPKLVSGYDDFLMKYNLARPNELGRHVHATDEHIAKGFEFEWKKHSKVLDEHEQEFLHVLGDVVPVQGLKGKVILDAGCGQGRFSYFLHKYGGRTVISFDLGEQVLLAAGNLSSYPNIHVVQASIYQPPFKAMFDYVFSIGVIHHLPHPEQAFQGLSGLLKKGGKIFIWVYGYSSIIPIIRFLRSFTLHRGVKFNWIFALVFAIPLYAINQVYNIMKKIPGLKSMAEFIPFHMYHDRGFSNVWTICFDKLNSGIAVYYRREDLEGWLTRMQDKQSGVLSERYAGKSGSSWRLMVEK